MRQLALLLGLTLFSIPARAIDGPVVDKALVIEGLIGRGSLAPIGDLLLETSKGDEKVVDIIISSPGGSVSEGFDFLMKMDEARKNGLHIRCFVPDIAASMAFQIFVHCDERYALTRAFLLYHRARIVSSGPGEPMTAPMFLHTGLELETLDNQILSETRNAMPKADPKSVEYHFNMETLHTGASLNVLAPGFLTAVDNMPGAIFLLQLQKQLNDAERRKTNPFGFTFPFKPGQLIYLAPRSKVINY